MGLGLEQGSRVERKSVLQQSAFCGKIVSLGSRRHVLRRKIKQCEGQVHAHFCSAVSSHPLHILQIAASWSKIQPAMDSRGDSMYFFLTQLPSSRADQCRDIKTTVPLHFMWKPEQISNFPHITDGPAGIWVCTGRMQPNCLSQHWHTAYWVP